MYKILKKSISIIIINIFIIPLILSTNTAFAEDPNYVEVFKDLKHCITDDDLKSNKLIQFIEEPFANTTKDKKTIIEMDITKDKKTSIEIRDCFQNTFQFKTPITEKATDNTTTTKAIKYETHTLAFRGNECSKNAQNAATSDDLASFTCRQVQAIISDPGLTFLYGYLAIIYRWAASIVGIIAVTIIVISGVQISASGGEPDALSSAKGRIIQSIAAIALLLLSGVLLSTLNPNFFT